MLGTQDLLVILVIVLVLVGKKRLREIAKGIGEGINNYTEGLSEPDETNITPERDKQEKGGGHVKEGGSSTPGNRK